MSENEKAVKQQKPHRFKQGINVVQPISSVGDIVYQSAKREIEDSDEDFRGGLQEVKKYVMPAMDALAIAGAKELSKSIKVDFNEATIACIKAKELLSDGSLSMVDLADKKLLKERLKGLEGLSAFKKKQIRKHRMAIYDLVQVKSAIEKDLKLEEHLEKTLLKHLKSDDFFDLRQQKTNELLKYYFKTNKNDVLKNVNPASMQEKQLKKLLKSADRNGFTEVDMSAIRIAGRQMKYRESRIKIGRLLNIKRRIEMISAYSYQVDGTVGAGLQNMAYASQVVHAVYSVGKFGLKAGIVSASFVAKYTGASYLLQRLNQIRKEKSDQMMQKAKEAIENTKAYQEAHRRYDEVRNKINATKESVGNKLNQNETVQKYKEIQKQTREKAKAVAKKANQTKAAAKSAKRTAQQGANIVLKPIRFIGKGINAFRVFTNKVKLVLFAAVGIVIAVFLILILLLNSVLSVSQTETSVALSTILTSDEDFVSDMTAELKPKVEAKRQEAENIAKGSPINPAVLEGHTITKYGYPSGAGSWTDGAKVVCVDGNGNVLAAKQNNIKDCLAMAYVIMDGDFDSNTTARDDLIKNLWELMNPEITYKESEIYTCPYGCDSFSYHCDNEADYTTMQGYSSNGVGFYESIEGYSEYGDGYEVTCNGCKDDKNKTIYHDKQSGTGEAEPAQGCTNYDVNYSCDGHSVGVCYGHKNIEVYMTVYQLEEMFVNNLLPDAEGKSYKSYLSHFEGWTADNVEWARLIVDSIWKDLYGIDPDEI